MRAFEDGGAGVAHELGVCAREHDHRGAPCRVAQDATPQQQVVVGEGVPGGRLL